MVATGGRDEEEGEAESTLKAPTVKVSYTTLPQGARCGCACVGGGGGGAMQSGVPWEGKPAGVDCVLQEGSSKSGALVVCCNINIDAACLMPRPKHWKTS